jgi:hypothetical protein
VFQGVLKKKSNNARLFLYTNSSQLLQPTSRRSQKLRLYSAECRMILPNVETYLHLQINANATAQHINHKNIRASDMKLKSKRNAENDLPYSRGGGGYRKLTYIVARLKNVKLYLIHYFLFFIILSGVRLSPLGTAATTGLLYQPRIIDDGDCGAIGGM